MNTPSKLLAFAAILGVAFGGAMLAGAVLDPTSEADMGRGHGGVTGLEGGYGDNAIGDPVGGLAVSHGGYILEPEDTTFSANEPARFAFVIADGQGRVVRDSYQLEAEREVHLIVVRRDASNYQHLHPTKDDAGVWSTVLALPDPGVYRAYVDFMIDGERFTLGTDLSVPGDFQPSSLPAPGSSAEVDGYDVALDDTGVTVDGGSELTFTVTRGARPVGTLQPYLGAKGHLVALREGDLAYLHVHPDDGAGAANEIQFTATFPTPGRYRLFLQFKADGAVRTVAHTLEVSR